VSALHGHIHILYVFLFSNTDLEVHGSSKIATMHKPAIRRKLSRRTARLTSSSASPTGPRRTSRSQAKHHHCCHLHKGGQGEATGENLKNSQVKERGHGCFEMKAPGGQPTSLSTKHMEPGPVNSWRLVHLQQALSLPLLSAREGQVCRAPTAYQAPQDALGLPLQPVRSSPDSLHQDSHKSGERSAAQGEIGQWADPSSANRTGHGMITNNPRLQRIPKKKKKKIKKEKGFRP